MASRREFKGYYMSFTVFYMNPGATPEVCEIIRAQMPPGWRLTIPNHASDFSEQLAEADFLVVATEPVRDEHLARAPKLKMIQHQGVGFEKIDLDACRRHNIPVGLTPEGTSVGVAEHTILLILSLYKRLVTAMNGIDKGEWMQWSLRQDSLELCGKTLGLVGFGRIGREVARRAIAFDARVRFFDPLVSDNFGLQVDRVDSLPKLLTMSDIVSLHVPVTADTCHLMNATTFSQMRPGSVLINTARGGLIDEAALIEALQRGHLGGAALDVFETEPLPRDNPLLSFTNVILTPHIAAGTRDALRTKMEAVFANLLRFTKGEALANAVPELRDIPANNTQQT